MEKINLSNNKKYDLETLDLNEPHVLDSIELSRVDRKKYGLISFVEKLIVINGEPVGALLPLYAGRNICSIILCK